MTTTQDRIRSALVTRKLKNEYLRPKHPKLLIENVSGNVFNNIAIRELFSDEIKDELRDLIDTGKEIPIDRLLGEYSPSELTITIYVKAIELFASSMKVNRAKVEMIVRLHEYAHAIFHVGWEDSFPIKDVATFLKQRKDIFDDQSTDVHEWIAQQMSYAVLCSEDWKAEREVFQQMMAKQPKIYEIDLEQIEGLAENLSDGKNARSSIWSCVLEQVRSRNLDPLNPEKYLH